MYSSNSSNLKYNKKLGLYKNSTGSYKYNPLTKESWSYNWWSISKVIGKYIIFNHYNYSNTTSKHNWITYSYLKNVKNVIIVSLCWDKYSESNNDKLLIKHMIKTNNHKKDIIKYLCKKLNLSYNKMNKEVIKELKNEKERKLKEKLEHKNRLKEFKKYDKLWKTKDIYINEVFI